jgi:oxygen-independent coproporphyrinogen III oxidase
VNAEHLYIHVPFCARRCVYCDFSIAVRSRVPVADFVTATAREWDLRHRDSKFSLDTLYFGGGTPSKLGSEGIARLMDVVTSRAELRPNAEVTLETNPEDVNSDAARGWRSSGVNRVSLGVQSFDDAVLAWMHRTHDASTARSAIEVLREAGFDNLSIDLIFAAPSQLARRWERDLETAIELGVPHVSVYGLTVEPHTPLGRWVARHDVDEAPEERFENEYLAADDALTQAGLEHYEVSNYGRPQRHSRHNWAYWRRRPYGGLGPSAHEFDGVVRRWNSAPYADWETRVRGRESPTVGSESLRLDQQVAEEVYLALRTTAGLRLSPDERVHVTPWIEAGWASLDGEGLLRLTAIGWLRLDALASDLTLFRSH